MAWNPSPKVAIARDYAKKFEQEQVIILAIDEYNNLTYASYGKTKKLCDDTEEIANIAFKAIMESYRGK